MRRVINNQLRLVVNKLHIIKRNKSSNMSIDLYYDDGSPPCHTVELVAAALDIKFNMKRVDIIGGDHLKPEFVTINPQHTVPTIVDGDFVLWESRAISRYLVNQYGKDSSLYPDEPRARAVVDQLLDFDVGVLYSRFSDYFYPPVFNGVEVDDALFTRLEGALQHLNTFLGGSTYAAGPGLTLADLGLVSTIAAIEAADIDLTPYPNILQWYALVKSTAKNYNEVMPAGIQLFKDIIENARARQVISKAISDNMSLDLYYTAGSAPCRLVLLVAAALDIHLNLKPLDLRAGDQFKPDFLKLNPQHTVPTLVDGDFSLWESRAISRYLVNQYGKGSTLYPEEPKARALVDQRLDFDLGVLYPRFANYFYPQVFGGAKADEAQLKKLEEALVFLNTFLAGRGYSAAPELTIADLSLIATVSTIDAAGIDLKPYPNVLKWYELVKSTAKNYDEANGKGIKLFKDMIAQLQAKTEL
ncbi:uncharacterized protein LOC128672663 [Plodia interpunctella]|uniref:uncharacterized protein LOC128672663 n=1 Tax=Plodia interpunctella TaxID=58824 RepID=UPI002367E9C3|nr:uncharacterized protein LOC128672663 [Plodia interpunctella]